MFRSLLTLLLLVSTNSTSVTPMIEPSFDASDLLVVESVPAKRQVAVAPFIEAKAALLIDVDTGLILYEKNAHQPLPMASLTKIMTAILILESHNLNEVVTVEADFDDYEELGVRIWLHQYEKITVGNLLIALLVRSAGDAAIALAEHHSGTVEAFVDEMNQRAQSLHLTHTNFQNPIGLDDEENYSSAFDLATLTRYALRYPAFRQIVQLQAATIESTNGKIKHSFKSTNYLLDSYLDIRGVKTGTTDEAGESLVNLARNRQRKEVLTVLLDSPERFQESKRLIDWAFRSYRW